MISLFNRFLLLKKGEHGYIFCLIDQPLSFFCTKKASENLLAFDSSKKLKSDYLFSVFKSSIFCLA